VSGMHAVQRGGGGVQIPVLLLSDKRITVYGGSMPLQTVCSKITVGY
jgi:hypothetical protein